MKASSLVGANMLRGWENEPERIASNAKQIVQWLSEGKIKTPPVARRYPLEQSAEAFRDVASGKTAGRIVIHVSSG